MAGILLGSVVLVGLILMLTALVIAARRVMMPALPAHLTLNDTRDIETVTGQKLLTALLDDGVNIPSACAGAGTCGLCRVRVTRGAPEILPVEIARLTGKEVRDGVHLACQVTVRGDMSVAIPDDLLAAESYACRVDSVRALTPLIREVTLALPEGHAPEIVAGSFVQLTAPPYTLDFADLEVPPGHAEVWEPLRSLRAGSDAPVTRAYSIANRPEDSAAGRIVLDIRLALPPPSVPGAPPGVVSSWLFSLAPGDMVDVAGPFGSFRMQDTRAEMVFLGGGVGIAPLRAMIFDALERQGTSRRMTFWYGARSRDDLVYVDELDALAESHDNFDWIAALSAPEPGDAWDGPTGFVHTVVWERLLRDHPAPEACEYYICGPPLMVAAILRMLDELGVEPEQIFNDDFGV